MPGPWSLKGRDDVRDSRRERRICRLDLLTVADVAGRIEEPRAPNDAREGRLAEVTFVDRQMREMWLQRDGEILGRKRRHPDGGEVAARDEIAHFGVLALQLPHDARHGGRHIDASGWLTCCRCGRRARDS